MRNIKRICSIFLIVVLLSLTMSFQVRADAGEIRTIYLSATEYDYPPFSVTDNGEADGFSVELLKAVAEEMGIVVTFKIDQWSVLKEELKNGDLDILPLVGYTEERDEIYDFSVPYIVMRGNIFVRKGYEGIQSEEDLFGKEILVLDGDNSQEWAWSIGLDSELTATTTYLEAFELLSTGQYDAVLAQGLVGEKLISDNELNNIEPVYIYDDSGITRQKLNLEGYEQKFCFAVVEGDTELLSILNEGLSIVSVNGTYDALYDKWFPFLIENEGLSTAEVIRYIAYIITPILALLVIVYFIVTRRTIRIKTKQISEEKDLSERYLRELILTGKIFESSIENAPIPIMIHAIDGAVLNISDTWTKLTGYENDDIPTIYDWTEKAYGLNKESVREVIANLYTLSSTLHDGECEVTTKDGSKLIWDFYSMHIGDLPDGRAVAMSVAMDVTERVKMDNHLKESEEKYRLLTTQMPLGLAVHELICDDKGQPIDFRFINVNEAWEKVMGIKKEFVLGKRVMEVFPNTEKYWIENYGSVALTGKPIFFENYSSELQRYFSSTVYSTKPGFFAVIIEDITKRTKLEKEKEYLLTHDILTGLTSRLYFNQEIIALDKKENLPLTVVNFDINGLIIINEAYGYEYGNEFLINVSRILKNVFDDKCIISRVGGDQFAVILTNTTQKDADTKSREVANQVMAIDVQGIHLSIAFGLSTKAQDEDVNMLFIAAENAMYSNKIFESQSFRNQSIQYMIKAYHEKNPREEEHSNRVSDFCVKFGHELGMSHEDINKLKAISYLHDIGKIAIDEAILNKPGKLTSEEWDIIKKHPEIGARIVSTLGEYSVISDDILAHHERIDGKGYPRGLSGHEIPLRARIISIIDSYDAMISDRPYRKALSLDEVITELYRCSGTQLDADLVDVFVKKVLKFQKL